MAFRCSLLSLALRPTGDGNMLHAQKVARESHGPQPRPRGIPWAQIPLDGRPAVRVEILGEIPAVTMGLKRVDTHMHDRVHRAYLRKAVSAQNNAQKIHSKYI